MIRQVTYIILIVIISIVCFSQTNTNKSNLGCYWEKIRLNTHGKEYKDTVVLLRNYKTDEKRIICNNIIIDEKTNNLIWKSKYLEVDLTYQNKQNEFSIILYKINNQKDTIACYFSCNRKTKETVQMVRFKIINKKISEINFPSISKTFIPVEEYDKFDFDAID